MEKIYTFNKNEFLIKQISKIELHFTNNDFLELSSLELVDKSIKLCDRLQRVGKGYCFFASEIILKFKIFSKRPKGYTAEYLCAKKQFLRNRKAYIENRCVNEQDLRNVQFYDNNNWHIDLFSNYTAEMDGEFLVIKGNYQGKSDDKEGSIYLRDIQLKDICYIHLDFENCEYFDVYNDEIVEFKPNYSEILCWGSGKLYREIESGYIRIKIANKDRRVSDWLKKHYTKKQLEERICGKEGVSEHDICHLYITSPYRLGDETIEVKDVRTDAELCEIEKLEEETGEEIAPCFIGGYAKKLDDGSICITFGKNAKEQMDKL